MSGHVRLFVYCWPNDDRTLLLAESREQALRVLREDLETDRELAEAVEIARFYEPNVPGVLLFASLDGTEFNLADASWQLEAGELLDEVLVGDADMPSPTPLRRGEFDVDEPAEAPAIDSLDGDPS